MTPPGAGLIHAERLEPPKIQTGNGLVDVMEHDPPQTRVAHSHDAGSSQNRHLSDEHHGRLLEKEREPAPLSCPGYIDLSDSVLLATDPRNLGGDVTVILKEVEMAPGQLLEIVCLAQPSANRTGVQGTPVRPDRKPKLMGNLRGVEDLPRYLPGLLKSQTQTDDIPAVHHFPPFRVDWSSLNSKSTRNVEEPLVFYLPDIMLFLRSLFC